MPKTSKYTHALAYGRASLEQHMGRRAEVREGEGNMFVNARVTSDAPNVSTGGVQYHMYTCNACLLLTNQMVNVLYHGTP